MSVSSMERNDIISSFHLTTLEKNNPSGGGKQKIEFTFKTGHSALQHPGRKRRRRGLHARFCIRGEEKYSPYKPERERKGVGLGWGRETNGPAQRDSTQSIILKQKQCCPGECLRSAYLIKSRLRSLFMSPPACSINLQGPGRVNGEVPQGYFARPILLF